jgi:ubiquinone/menaquinone biosynthesis C-methylase UbiE
MATIFEDLYRNQSEPWRYSDRAIELVRHDWTLELIAKYLPQAPGRRVLDVGCSLGLLTSRIAELTPTLTAIDIAPTAVEKAKTRCAESQATRGTPVEFRVGGALEIPARDGEFDLVVCADGIHGWEFSDTQKTKAFSEVNRVLAPGGIAIFTDALRPNWFEGAVKLVEQSPLKVIEIDYFGDRLWYQLESAVKAVRTFPGIRWCLSNKPLARSIRSISKLRGPSGSIHLGIVAQKPSPKNSRETA